MATGSNSIGVNVIGHQTSGWVRLFRVTTYVPPISFPDYGVWSNNGARPEIIDCELVGASKAISNNSSTAKVANSMLCGGVEGSGFTCVGCYSCTYGALDAICEE